MTQRFKPWPTIINAPLTLALAGCQASNMGAAPQHWDLSKLPRAKDIDAYAESSTTASAQRVAPPWLSNPVWHLRNCRFRAWKVA